ncbi:MAG: hypothetical protein OXB88_08580 [Bacteriovoracales bacterium]|nr:hypothetical protein [Bacteriovoracales bacterium]
MPGLVDKGLDSYYLAPMKAAVLGSNRLAEKAKEMLEEMKARVLCFDPQKVRFYVQKRSLAIDENIPGKDRFYDLFRIVYERGHSSSFAQNLGQEDARHLLTPSEVFVDVDVVVDTMDLKLSTKRPPLLNERFHPIKESVSVGWPTNAKEYNRVAVILKSKGCLNLLKTASSWALEKGRKLFVLGKSFSFLSDSSEWQCLLDEAQNDLEKRKKRLEEEMKKWSALESYERAKVKRPELGDAPMEFFEGYWPLGIDYLSDRKLTLLTLERPEFRGGEDLKTLAMDCIAFEDQLSTENDPSFWGFGIVPREKGHIVLGSDLGSVDSGLKHLKTQIERLFTRVDSEASHGP